MPKSFEGTEKWFRTERGLQLKIEIDLYSIIAWHTTTFVPWEYGFKYSNFHQHGAAQYGLLRARMSV